MRCKKDLIHHAVENVFKLNGYETIDTSTCHGVLLDFIANYFDKTGKLIEHWFIEVKTGNKKFSNFEKKFINKNQLNSIVIRGVKEAMDFCYKKKLQRTLNK